MKPTSEPIGPPGRRRAYFAHNALSTPLLTPYKVLVRDDFRCMVTDLFDHQSLKDNAYLQGKYQVRCVIQSLSTSISWVPIQPIYYKICASDPAYPE